jgi:hypothetical protein
VRVPEELVVLASNLYVQIPLLTIHDIFLPYMRQHSALQVPPDFFRVRREGRLGFKPMFDGGVTAPPIVFGCRPFFSNCGKTEDNCRPFFFCKASTKHSFINGCLA